MRIQRRNTYLPEVLGEENSEMVVGAVQRHECGRGGNVIETGGGRRDAAVGKGGQGDGGRWGEGISWVGGRLCGRGGHTWTEVDVGGMVVAICDDEGLGGGKGGKGNSEGGHGER